MKSSGTASERYTERCVEIFSKVASLLSDYPGQSFLTGTLSEREGSPSSDHQRDSC